MRETTPTTYHKSGSYRFANGFRYLRFTTMCKQFAVEKATYLGRAFMPDMWRALRKGMDDWEIMSTHRSRAAAETAVRRNQG